MFDLFRVVGAKYDEVSKFLHLQMRGRGDEGDDVNSEPVDDSPFIQQLGFAVLPIVQRSLRSLGYRYGDDVWTLKLWDKKKPVLNMETGESRMYSVGNLDTQIRLLQDQTAEVRAQTIKLGEGATKGAARVDDTTENGTISFGAAGNALTVTFTPPTGAPQTVTIGFTSAAGPVSVTVSPPTTSLSLSGKIDAGSAKTTIE